jgi:AbrB family looped-hinge helix DNA binding protein
VVAKIVEMASNGRLVIPVEARQLLGLRNEASKFEVDVRDGMIMLIPVVTVRVDVSFPITDVVVASAARAAAETGVGLDRAELVAAMQQQKDASVGA